MIPTNKAIAAVFASSMLFSCFRQKNPLGTSLVRDVRQGYKVLDDGGLRLYLCRLGLLYHDRSLRPVGLNEHEITRMPSHRSQPFGCICTIEPMNEHEHVRGNPKFIDTQEGPQTSAYSLDIVDYRAGAVDCRHWYRVTGLYLHLSLLVYVCLVVVPVNQESSLFLDLAVFHPASFSNARALLAW